MTTSRQTSSDRSAAQSHFAIIRQAALYLTRIPGAGLRLLLLGGLLLTAGMAAPAVIRIDPSQVIAHGAARRLGINVDYLMDDDHRLARGTATAAAIHAMGLGYVRYPGGEKSDNYLWSAPPWHRPAPQAARAHAFPATDARFFESDQRTARPGVLDFDEFMTLCRAAGVQPVICVAFDSMYKPAKDEATPPSKAQLLQNAVEWVRYANIEKGYAIRHWTLGNETDYPESYAGKNPGSAIFGADLAEFARAMKAVDPSIHIGVNGHSREWFADVLAVAGSYVDFLDVHTYPFYNFKSYAEYQQSDGDALITREVETVAQASIDAITDPALRQRLYLVLSETGALGFPENPGWANVNNLGKALATFDILARHLEKERVAFVLLWNTRWTENDRGRIRPDTALSRPAAVPSAEPTVAPSAFDALDQQGNLNATGQVLALLGNHLQDEMVAVSGETAAVRCYASRSHSGALSLFLLNKDSNRQNITLQTGLTGSRQADVWRFHGTGIEDTAPIVSRADSIKLPDGNFEGELPALSITVLEIAAPGER